MRHRTDRLRLTTCQYYKYLWTQDNLRTESENMEWRKRQTRQTFTTTFLLDNYNQFFLKLHICFVKCKVGLTNYCLHEMIKAEQTCH